MITMADLAKLLDAAADGAMDAATSRNTTVGYALNRALHSAAREARHLSLKKEGQS